jgi:hypothetical protein
MVRFTNRVWAAVLMTAAWSPWSQAVTPTEQLVIYSRLAGVPAKPERGQELFITRHGRDWSCATCHTASPTVTGKHASTGKQIGALAPEFNPDRFVDPQRTDKWFRRNCNDVLGRECTAGEKADVLSWLLTFKR